MKKTKFIYSILLIIGVYFLIGCSKKDNTPIVTDRQILTDISEYVIEGIPDYLITPAQANTIEYDPENPYDILSLPDINNNVVVSVTLDDNNTKLPDITGAEYQGYDIGFVVWNIELNTKEYQQLLQRANIQPTEEEQDAFKSESETMILNYHTNWQVWPKTSVDATLSFENEYEDTGLYMMGIYEFDENGNLSKRMYKAYPEITEEDLQSIMDTLEETQPNSNTEE